MESSTSHFQDDPFRQVVEMAPIAVLMVSEAGLIELANVQAEKVFGYSRDELLGRSVDSLLPQNLQAQHSHHRHMFFHNPSPRAMGSGRDLFARRKDGREFPVEIGLNPIHTPTGMKVLSTIVDISERKQVEARQQQLLEDLKRINEELDSFAFVASHDLKSPLRGIDQLATWIIEDVGDAASAETQDHVRLMRGRIKRMERLLDDLLAYSRVGRTDSDISTVDTSVLVRDIFDLMDTLKPVSLDLSQNMPVLQTRKVPLELVFRNLISNAIKHNDKPAGRIAVDAQAIDGGYVFTVADNGPGIAPEHQKRVFEMFQTLKPRDELEGSGIGLALVKKAIHLAGGKISVDSDGRNGCKFLFVWPNSTEGERT